MRVVITSNTLGFGGAERQRVILANELSRRGHTVEMRLIQASGPLAEQLSPAVEVVRPAALADVRVAGRRGGSIVLVGGTTQTEVAHCAAIRAAHPLRSGWVVAAHNPVVRGVATYPPLVRALVRGADRQVCLSPGQADALVGTDGFSHRKIDIIPNGIDTTPFERVRQERRGRARSGPFRLGFVGRLAPVKGLDLLLEALGGCLDLDWVLDVSGDGPVAGQLQADPRFAAVNRRVTWHGARSAAQALRDCDLFVVPSRNEAFPLVVIEALVAGVPVVATDVGSTADILGGAAAALVARPEAALIAEGLRAAMDNYDKAVVAAEVGADGAVGEYSSATMVDRYNAVIDQVARKGRR